MAVGKQQRRGIWAAAGAVGVYLFDPVLTVIRLNVEVWANKNGFDQWLVGTQFRDVGVSVLDGLETVWSFLSGDFALGFAAAAIIFSFWEPITRIVEGTSGRKQRIAAARRWIKLAESIQADLSNRPRIRQDHSGTEAMREARDEMQQSYFHSLVQRHSGAIFHVKAEMLKYGVPLGESPLRMSILRFVNEFEFIEIAEHLSRSGREVLIEMGEDPA